MRLKECSRVIEMNTIQRIKAFAIENKSVKWEDGR